jgi:hypothetical protein
LTSKLPSISLHYITLPYRRLHCITWHYMHSMHTIPQYIWATTVYAYFCTCIFVFMQICVHVYL